MAEIISLLSSSPPQSPPLRTVHAPSRMSPRQDLSSLTANDFDFSDELDFPIEQPSKRRRVTPRASSADQNGVTATTANVDAVFDLSSEPDICETTQHRILDHPPSNQRIFDFELDDFEAAPFSSSAPEPSKAATNNAAVIFDLLSDDENFGQDPIFSSSQPAASSRPAFSERTTNFLSNLNKFAKLSSKATGSSRGVEKSKGIRASAVAVVDNIKDSSQTDPEKARSKKVLKVGDGDHLERTASRAKDKAIKDADKEAEKQRKKLDKEEKLREKQKAADIAEVNKSKTNKKNSTPEMIVEMQSDLKGTSVGTQVEEFMKQLGVQTNFLQKHDLISDEQPTAGQIIKWRRKVTAEYDKDQEIWKPLPQPKITKEKHVLVYLKADEFIAVAAIGSTGNDTAGMAPSELSMKANLDIHISSLRINYPDCTIVYLIQGLTAWLKKNVNAKNRAYTAAVRAQGISPLEDAVETSQPRPRKRKTPTSQPPISLDHINEAISESLLLHLQLNHQPLLIHHTTSVHSTACQISSFTQHLSTRPYRLASQSHNLQSASFCMESGQVRTGDSASDTYLKMLQEINRVTPSMAHGISAAGYDSVKKLADGFRREGNLMLEDVRKAMNKDGGWSDRRLGPMVSKRLYRVFLGRDPAARDGIA